MKTCETCKHYCVAIFYRTTNTVHENVGVCLRVDDKLAKSARRMRIDCGPSGSYWEPKESEE